MAWFLPQAPHLYWTTFVFLGLAFPSFISFFSTLLIYPKKINFKQTRINLSYELSIGFEQTLCQISLLLYYAVNMLDAIGRTIYRLLISKRKLLEWVSAAQKKIQSKLSLNYFLRQHLVSVCVAMMLETLILVSKIDNEVKILASPFIILWMFSPLVAYCISLPPKSNPIELLNSEEIDSLRLIARRTWKYFTSFVTEYDNLLPPDNFQETPVPAIAHRSSPTNFGLYLLSIISAKDFTWLGLEDMVLKLENTVEVLEELPRYKGHFYNWYDLLTKEPLHPQYISSVDSGNCAAYLLVTAQACEEFAQSSILSLSKTEGLRDTLSLLRESLIKVPDKKRTLTVTLEELQEATEHLELLMKSIAGTPSGYLAKWQSMEIACTTLLDITKTFVQEHEKTSNNDILLWVEEIAWTIESQLKDLKLILPWVKIFNLIKSSDLSAASIDELEKLNSPEILGLSLIDLSIFYKEVIASLICEQKNPSNSLLGLILALKESVNACEILMQRLMTLSKNMNQLFEEMDFSFLFDPTRKLFSIGFNVDNNSLDPSYYDMLASEARVTSFIAIAKGEVPVKHWFSLGRTLTPLHNGAALLSWSGSMFEYLMPSLIMYTPLESLLDKTCRLIIEKQIQYGAEQNVPWGISESAYNIRDLHFTYQYSSFGVPGLGLKRGIAQDLVISPYSTALAAMYYPRSALDNFKRLKEKGALGSYGFYESMDFTATRLPEKKQFAIVYAYMAHHQGMSLIALANVVFPGIMRHRFHNIPKIKATELILQERTPHSIAVEQPEISQSEKTHIRDLVQPNIRYFNLPNLSIPTTHFLSNGHYTVMISTSGSGYSSCNDTAVSRWREDATRDIYGSYVFLHDTSTKQSWSATYQPTAVRPDDYEVTFTEDKAKFIREDNGIITTLEIVVSVEENAEIRRVSIKNTNIFSKEIEITSYGEVVLAPQATDVMHPAFSNLFVETEYLAESSTLIASRRPRSAKEQCLWMAHTIAVEGTTKAGIEYETDRARFLGRGHSIRDAVAVIEGQPLSNTVGPVLDPIVSLRTRINIPSGATRNILFSTMTGNSREEIIELADKYHDPSIFERASSLAWTYSQAQLHHLAIDDVEANLFQQLASNLVYSSSVTRPSSKNLKLNSANVTGLWAHSISGDYPILLVHIDNIEDVGLVSELLHAYEYLRLKRFFFDLVIINEKANSYVQDLQIILENMVQTSWQSNVFVLRADLLSKAEKELFETAARIVLYCKDGSLTDQVISFQRSISKLIYQNKNRFSNISQSKVSLDQPALEFFNGLGGFANNGKEYVIILNKLQYTPAPWINIIANSQIGFLVSESGSGYSWSLNSRENQISTWSNDPVEDPSSEIFYILDEESKEFWTPTALPIRCENTTYISKHGQGYSSFEHLSHGIESRLTQFVSYDDPIKISRLYLKNHSNKARRLSILAYIELVLGSSRAANAPYIITEIDDETKAMFAYNPWSIDFGKRITFIDFCGKQVSSTADRKEFIGRNGNLKQPAALIEGKALSGKFGAGLDPCFAQKLLVELSANESVELTFFLGQSDDKESAINLIKNYRSRDLNLVLDNVKNQWEATLGKIEVETPDRETDFLLNRWSLYQTLTCRYLARTAFYQAGGAYGFRDQLQDVMALVVSHPEITRAQILKACAQQFPEGDVQHWWHPPSNKGVRTKCSDDSLWLPYTLHHYIKNTGDYKILDEQITFIEGRSLLSEEESAYYEPTKSIQTATVLEHCKRILDRSMKVGAHGLPLIGSGDWNDGMNMIGHKGYGESVWLGWFLYATLVNYSALVKDYYKDDSIVLWLKHAEDLKHSLETETWDGAWYKRAYFDDGTPLGSASNAECRIDSIAQSWSVISKAADIDRATKAMESVEKHLVKTGDNLLLLFTPPFDKTQHDPGYIKGYLPGIRENGGQYTHAATWTVIAFAMLGNGNKAYELFSMLNPINHTNTRAGVYKYKIEPYVVAADIYSEPPHVGRGGWSWYTGSAAWIYRTGIEWILGLTVTENTLWINPCIPDDWKGFTVKYKHGSAKYIVSVTNVNSTGNKVKVIELDGQIIPEDKGIPLIDDNREHLVNISYQK
jgi:cyclic beta-1,2-glucan synthetase